MGASDAAARPDIGFIFPMKEPDTYDVIGIGVSTLDIIHLVDRFPAGEEVQKSSASVLSGGGPVATAIVTLARLGARTAMLDSLGDDWRGDLIREEFSDEKVDTGYSGTRRSRGSRQSMSEMP